MVLGVMLGACLSVAIPACADDDPVAEKEESSEEMGSSNGQGSSNDEGKQCTCGYRQLASHVYYDEEGKVSNKGRYDYDDQGRQIKSYQEAYSTTNTGVHYLSSTTTITYTYLTNGNQTSVSRFVSYNEHGQQTSVRETRGEMVYYGK